MNESSRMGLVGSQAILDGQRRAEDTFVGLRKTGFLGLMWKQRIEFRIVLNSHSSGHSMSSVLDNRPKHNSFEELPNESSSLGFVVVERHTYGE